MGWGWCSGTALWGDLAISRGVDVSFRSWDALLDERLPVGTGQGGGVGPLCHRCYSPQHGGHRGQHLGEATWGGGGSSRGQKDQTSSFTCLFASSSCVLSFTHLLLCLCSFLKNSFIRAFVYLFFCSFVPSFLYSSNRKYLWSLYYRPSTVVRNAAGPVNTTGRKPHRRGALNAGEKRPTSLQAKISARSTLQGTFKM